jgi:hypothetical protein
MTVFMLEDFADEIGNINTMGIFKLYNGEVLSYDEDMGLIRVSYERKEEIDVSEHGLETVISEEYDNTNERTFVFYENEIVNII